MKKAKHLTINEWRQFREAFKREVEESDHSKVPVRNRAIIELLFTLTLRVSDLLSLKVKDVTDKNGNIKDKVNVTEQKNNNFKGVKLRDKPKDALRDWLDIADLDRDDFLFSSPYVDGHLSRQQVDNIIKDKLPEVEFEFVEDKTIATHSGRKTIATRLWNGDVKTEKIVKALGHNDAETTRNYIGVTDRDVNEAIMGLED